MDNEQIWHKNLKSEDNKTILFESEEPTNRDNVLAQ